MFQLILRIIYLTMVAILIVFVGWHGYKTKNIYEKITAALMLVVLVLRLFLIK